MNRLVSVTLLLLLSIVSLLPTDGRIILTEDETIESDQLNQARPPTVDEVRASLPYNVSTVLADYIAREEEVYSFVELPQFQEQGIGFTSYVLNVTSLRWLDETKVSRSIWWHFVVIFVPTTPEPRFVSNAFLYITGNTNLDSRPPSITSLGDWFPQIELVTEGKQVVVTIFQIPNAPIQFFEEKPVPLNRTEDAMIAWTWKHFLSDPSDPTWLARLPMVKSCIQAMNAATEYMANRATGPFQQLQRWVVAGASKRGWTTWLVGAMDTRVIAIAPLVFDELNFVANIHHHYRAYGGWSFALKDYVALNLTGAFDDPLLAVMMEIVDPYSYFKTSRLAEIPKFVVSASGDEFLLTDNIRYFWDEMPGPKHFISWPNLEHSMGGNPFEVINSVLSYTVQVQLNQTLPDYSWYINNSDGSIYLIVDQPWPDSVEFWYAQTIDGSARRDFRLATCPDGCPNPRKYTMHNVTWVNDNQYLDINTKSYGLMKIGAWMNVPPSGWVAFSVTLGWKDQNGGIFNVSTAPSILPMSFPYPDCQGTGCIAGMV